MPRLFYDSAVPKNYEKGSIKSANFLRFAKEAWFSRVEIIDFFIEFWYTNSEIDKKEKKYGNDRIYR